MYHEKEAVIYQIPDSVRIFDLDLARDSRGLSRALRGKEV